MAYDGGLANQKKRSVRCCAVIPVQGCCMMTTSTRSRERSTNKVEDSDGVPAIVVQPSAARVATAGVVDTARIEAVVGGEGDGLARQEEHNFFSTRDDVRIEVEEEEDGVEVEEEGDNNNLGSGDDPALVGALDRADQEMDYIDSPGDAFDDEEEEEEGGDVLMQGESKQTQVSKCCAPFLCFEETRAALERRAGSGSFIRLGGSPATDLDDETPARDNQGARFEGGYLQGHAAERISEIA